MNNAVKQVSQVSEGELFNQELEAALAQSNQVLIKAKKRITVLETARIELSFQVSELSARLDYSVKLNEALSLKIKELETKSLRDIAGDVGMSKVDGQRLDVVLKESTRSFQKAEQGLAQRTILSRLKEEYAVAWYSGFAAVDVEGLIDAIRDIAIEVKKSGQFKRI